jgi:hypothetical protein
VRESAESLAIAAEMGPLLRQPVELTNLARRWVRTITVCCSIPSAQMLEFARAGRAMFADVANL